NSRHCQSVAALVPGSFPAWEPLRDFLRVRLQPGQLGREGRCLPFEGVQAVGLGRWWHRVPCVGSCLWKLLPDQLVLLLEHLLEQKTLNPRTLQSLERAYRLTQQDAEVRHRWCELIIKHKYTKAYKDVERFLQEDQAMGIYLYGELMVSEDSRQQQAPRRCFELTKEQMDRSSAQVVAEMLF
uniref:Peptidase M1 leukotriene A4 hydrolase/aminopeptidase C-terminal domain-containing protein n=1 Tax=Panthera tigris altaica TaxID=74533 RepID=A0A8C9M4E3_PANTA